MANYLIKIDIVDHNYVDQLIVALTRQGYIVSYDKDSYQVCFECNDGVFERINSITDLFNDESEKETAEYIKRKEKKK